MTIQFEGAMAEDIAMAGLHHHPNSRSKLLSIELLESQSSGEDGNCLKNSHRFSGLPPIENNAKWFDNLAPVRVGDE
jgi:hypothetical protein